MTFAQFKVYVRHPLQYLHSLWIKFKARRAARKFMRKLTDHEAYLKAAADPSCGKCYGRGHRGFDIVHKRWVVCTCTSNPRTVAKKEEKPWLRG